MTQHRPRRRVRTTALLAAVTITSVAAGTAALSGSAAAAAPVNGAMHVLSSDVVYGLSHLENDNQHAATPASTVLSLGVSVAGRDPAGLAAFDNSVNTKGSPDYRDFLTPAQFQQRFGATTEAIAGVKSWLSSGGLTVYTHAQTPAYLTATGTASQVGALMKTSFVSFPSLHFYANTTGPTVPAAVLGVAGLNTGVRPRIADPVHKAPKTRADSPPTGELSPMDLWDIYDQPANDEGQGESMALFGLGSLTETVSGQQTGVEFYLRQFEKEYNLPQIDFQPNYFESDPKDLPTATDGMGEWILDAQAADGMAPLAKAIVEYFGAGETDADGVGSYQTWADDPNGPLQGSTSWGYCEQVPEDSVVTSNDPVGVTYLGDPAQDMYEAIWAQLVSEGRTLFSASGDVGTGCGLATDVNGATLDPLPIQNTPGNSPNVVGVGGSVLYFDGESGSTPASRITEYPWPYSSGGRDYFEPANTWQAAAVQPFGSGTPASGTPIGSTVPVDTYLNPTDYHGTPYATPQPARIQPDVAALSGDITGNGYTISDENGNDDFGAGTSLSSPLWLGMWARVQAAAPPNAQGRYVGLGFAESTIYSLADQSTYNSAFYDLGNPTENPPSVPTTNGSTNPGGPGFDAQTGWGVLDVTNFAKLADAGNPSLTPTDPSGDNVGSVPSDLPEAPLTALLLLPGIGVAAVVMAARRRRSIARSGP